MPRQIEINDDTVSVSPIDGNNGAVEVQLGERRTLAEPVAGEPNRFRVQCDGIWRDCYVAQGKDGTWVAVDGRARLVRKQQRRGAAATDNGPTRVTPPMPGVVVRVMVNVGDSVTRGQKVVVVSAMKMETALPAPYDGTVTSVNTEEGANVMPGEQLIDIEPRETEGSHE